MFEYCNQNLLMCFLNWSILKVNGIVLGWGLEARPSSWLVYIIHKAIHNSSRPSLDIEWLSWFSLKGPIPDSKKKKEKRICYSYFYFIFIFLFSYL